MTLKLNTVLAVVKVYVRAK